MIEALPPHVVRAGLGLLIGTGLGYVARRGRFCTLGAIEDALYGGDTARLRAWGLAIAVAIAGTHLLTFAGLDLSRAIYAGPRLEWAGAVVGGLMFGFGMALVGTCGFGSLLRLGGGDLKAFMTVLVLGFSALMALRGLTGLVRIGLLDPLAVSLASSQRVPDLLTPSGAGQTAVVAAAIVLVLAWVLASPAFRRSGRLIGTGVAIGLLVVAGWWATGIVGNDPFDPRRVESFSFVAPVGETLAYAMWASALRVDFAVGSVVGVLAGSFLAAWRRGEFRWEAPDDVREVRRHALGAFLMGTGGVAALGCTVGQGLTGLSTLSLGSVLAIVSIASGAVLGLRRLVEGSS